jgi:spermidine synthase
MVPVGLALILLFNSFQMRFVTLPENGKLIEHVEGVMAAVTVVQDRRAERYLKINNNFIMGGTATFFSDRRQAYIPLLLHKDPKRALFLGLGTGATFAVAADYPELEADGVELIPEIIPLLPYFEKSTVNFGQYERLHIKVADARRFVNASQEKYDVIIADLFHPARDGAGSLYTVEHFKAIRSLLKPEGLFCQWLPLYQLDLDVLRIIIRTFLHVYPYGKAFLAHYSLKTPMIGLISGAGPIRYSHDWIDQRIKDETLYDKLKSLRLHNPYSLFGSFIADSKDLFNFAGNSPLNTDDRPIVTFEAPRFLYTKQQPAYVRLFALVNEFNPRPEQILKPAKTDEERQAYLRLVAYWEARNSFLHAGVNVPQTRDITKLLKKVRGNCSDTPLLTKQ